jgi:hypothetical protein
VSPALVVAAAVLGTLLAIAALEEAVVVAQVLQTALELLEQLTQEVAGAVVQQEQVMEGALAVAA